MEQYKAPEINPYIYSQLIIKKGAKNTQWGKNSVLRKLDSHMEKNETGPLSHTIHKNQPIIKDLNVRSKTIKLLEENIRKKLLHTDMGNYFLDSF